MQSERFHSPSRHTVSPAIISLIVIVVIGVTAGAVYAATRSDQDDARVAERTDTSSSRDANPSAPTGNSTDTNDSTASQYADGTYTATGDYITPGGSETIAVTATLASGKVTNVSATGSARGGDSAQYQSRFLSAYKSLVVGRAIDGLSLSRVAGSSLTSNGFNAAIQKIKRDALN